MVEWPSDEAPPPDLPPLETATEEAEALPVDMTPVFLATRPLVLAFKPFPTATMCFPAVPTPADMLGSR